MQLIGSSTHQPGKNGRDVEGSEEAPQLSPGPTRSTPVHGNWHHKEGGHVLKTRLARGSTSLECFHLHMNTFIPGTLASDIFLQAYLLDGLARWNEDRSMSAEGRSEPDSYSGLLRHAATQLSQEVLGKSCVNYTGPQAYTGVLAELMHESEETEFSFDQALIRLIFHAS
ncbi:uncharacterized protein [Nothobranchius furzeri]|uniref:uncharacterized protein isoform X3 n=1 Tax=Nothobranchius furzeri TaxID=105023 RepID=UPI0039046E5A